jgi:hypothetical protein
MPTYDYLCNANGQVVEVSHRMSELMHTWGELCTRAGIEPGQTPENTPVQRLATGGHVVSGSNLGSGIDTGPACTTGSCCPGGVCGID